MIKIVVAEDDKLISDSLCDALKSQGYEVTAAYDGEAALAKIKEIMPDLALLDIMMPKMDGISVLQGMRSDSATAQIPVIVLTNLGDIDTISKIVRAGAADYLLKSDQSVDNVMQKIKEVLARGVKLT